VLLIGSFFIVAWSFTLLLKSSCIFWPPFVLMFRFLSYILLNFSYVTCFSCYCSAPPSLSTFLTYLQCVLLDISCVDT
jgi:hypothetical protein